MYWIWGYFQYLLAWDGYCMTIKKLIGYCPTSRMHWVLLILKPACFGIWKIWQYLSKWKQTITWCQLRTKHRPKTTVGKSVSAWSCERVHLIMIVSSFGGNILKLFIQCAFKIFSRMCRKSHGSESGQKLKMSIALCQLNTTELAWASLCPGAWKSSSHLESWAGLSCLFSRWFHGISFASKWACILHAPTTCQQGLWVFWVIMLKIIPLFFLSLALF